ncbi:MAG: hypothetical protein QOD80_868 [Verrucomicrobiota bacterium]
MTAAPRPDQYPSRFDTRWVGEVLALAALYFLTARLGLAMAMPGAYVTPVWPPSGIALAAVLLRGPRVWPGIFLGSFAVNFWHFYGSPGSLAAEVATPATMAIGACLAALLGRELLRRFAYGRHSLERVLDVCAFMALGGVVCCLVSATIGVTTLCLAGFAAWSDYGQAWLTWWLGDTGGVFIVSPLLLVWGGAHQRKLAGRWAELFGGFSLMIAVTYYVFCKNTAVAFKGSPLTFIILIPFLVWAAVRFGRRGAAMAVGLIALLAVWGTIHQAGPFNLGPRNEALLLLELFLGVMALAALCLAAMVTEREHLAAARQRVVEELESHVRGRTSALAESEAQARQHLAEAERARAALLSILEDQREVEEKLRESQTRTQLLVKSSNIGLWDWNLVTNDVFFSPEWKSQLGYTDGEVPGRYEEWENRLHPEDRASSLRAVQDFREGCRADYDVEFRMRHKDGSWRSILTHADLIRDASGKPVRMMGCHIDITARKQAEEKLRESETRFRELAENIDEVFWVWTATPKKPQLLYVSPAYATIWGRSCESLYGSPQSWKEALHPDDKKWVLAEIAHLDFEKVNDLSYRIVRRDQSIRWIRDRIFPVRDRAGVVVRFAGIAEDITESKKNADALERAEKQYHSIFNDAIEGIFRTSLDGKFLVANPAAARILGFDSPEQLIAERGDIAQQGYVDPRRREELKRVMQEQGVVNSFEYEAYRKDGSRVWICENARAVKSPSGEVLYFEGIFEDVTERKRAEKALRESEERFRTIFEQAPLGISEGEIATERFLSANQRYVDILGYSLDALRELTFRDYTHPEDLQKDLVQFQKLATGQIRSYAMEKRYIRKDGTLIWVNLTVTGLARPGEKPLNCIAVIEDITDRVQAEDRLRRSEEKFKTLFGIAPVGIAFLDSRLNIVDCNPALERMSRLSRQELLGNAWRRRTFLNADGSPRLRGERVAERGVRERRPVNKVETGAVMESGDIVWAEVSVAPLALPDAMAVVIMQDITERKQTEQARERGLSLMLATLESTADGILVVNTEGKIETFNRLFARMWRVPDEILASREDARALECVVDQLIAPEQFLQKVSYLYQHPEEESFDQLVFKDGRVFERYSRPQRIGGEVAGRVWSFRDITERNQAREALQNANRQLQSLSRRLFQVQEQEKRHLARELHDEIGQALTAVKINLTFLGTGKDDNSLRLEETIALLDNLLRQVRQISLDLHPSLLDDLGLAAALRSLLDQQARRAGLRAQFFAAQVADNIDAAIQTTAFRIVQEAITNVLRHARASFIKVQLRTEAGRLRIKVTDDGAGFDVVEANQRAHQHAGFGLMGMKERAALVGGEVEVTSAPDTGTSVQISLPLRENGFPR